MSFRVVSGNSALIFSLLKIFDLILKDSLIRWRDFERQGNDFERQGNDFEIKKSRVDWLDEYVPHYVSDLISIAGSSSKKFFQTFEKNKFYISKKFILLKTEKFLHKIMDKWEPAGSRIINWNTRSRPLKN